MASTQPANPTLHILNKPPGHPRFETCLQAIQDGDQLVLTENAVLALADHSVALPDACKAMKADVDARALDEQARTATIDYAELVRLTAEHSRIISW
ncbi:sulfurtransferase complex subunit TusB [uncultured Marinobacter sp.]|uniref:sulfurtransferase complex subunit TusB n=1 Tax=uncultured Marinobacter sp. TaxID=187379 RepID=UPI002594DF1E|nr:sulfurtransferase complex subunit TusB [uncultured Marinobacter sp.]